MPPKNWIDPGSPEVLRDTWEKSIARLYCLNAKEVSRWLEVHYDGDFRAANNALTAIPHADRRDTVIVAVIREVPLYEVAGLGPAPWVEPLPLAAADFGLQRTNHDC